MRAVPIVENLAMAKRLRTLLRVKAPLAQAKMLGEINLKESTVGSQVTVRSSLV